MTIREYLISIGATESYCKDIGYRTEFTIYDKDVEHAISFISNATFDENDEYFDVYFWGRDYNNSNNHNFVHVFSRMRVTTIEEVKFILEHLV